MDCSWQKKARDFKWQSGRAATNDYLSVLEDRSKSKSLPCLKLFHEEENTGRSHENQTTNFQNCAIARMRFGDANYILDNSDVNLTKLRDVKDVSRKLLNDGTRTILKQNEIGLIGESCTTRMNRSLSAGFIETNLDTWKSHEVSCETNLDDIFKQISVPKTENPSALRRWQRERAKSVEFLMDTVQRTAAEPPENKLARKKKILSQHELRIERSLERLDIPHWFRKSMPAKQIANKKQSDFKTIVKRAPEKVKREPNKSSTVLNSPYGWHLLSFTNRKSFVQTKQPYLGWRSMDKLTDTGSCYKSVTERLSSRPEFYRLRYSNDSCANKHRTNLPNTSKLSRKIGWIETSFVGPPPKGIDARHHESNT